MVDRRPVLGVFGGSFDPVHVGHTMLPAYLFARGVVDRVLVAPCWSHALGKSLTPFERRLAFADRGFASYGPRVEVSDIEAELARASAQGEPSYTLHLLQALQRRRPNWRVRLVIGSDIIASGETERWHRWGAIEADFDPIVVPRVGYTDDLTPLPQISSTDIRTWLEDPARHRRRLEGALPAEVLRLATTSPAGRIVMIGHGHAATHARRHLAAAEPWFEVEQVGARALLQGRGTRPPLDAAAPVAVWILARDAAVEALSARLGELGIEPSVPVLHGAGSRLAREALAPAAAAGHPVGTLHPICSLRAECAGSRLWTAGWGIEGDAAARAVAQQLAGAGPKLDLQGLSAPERRRYHAACALVANHVAVLRQGGHQVLADLLPEAGGPGLDAVVDELLRSAVENLVELGVPAGVSGPVARGEMDVARAHAQVLGGETGRLYRVLSEALARLMEASPADPA